MPRQGLAQRDASNKGAEGEVAAAVQLRATPQNVTLIRHWDQRQLLRPAHHSPGSPTVPPLEREPACQSRRPAGKSLMPLVMPPSSPHSLVACCSWSPFLRVPRASIKHRFLTPRHAPSLFLTAGPTPLCPPLVGHCDPTPLSRTQCR